MTIIEKFYKPATETWYTRRDDGKGLAFVWYVDSVRYENHYPSDALLASEGYLPLQQLAAGQYQRIDYTTVVVEADHVTYAVTDWTQEEIDTAIQAAADLATLTEFQTLYTELMYWDGKTDAELDTLINNYFNSSDPVQIGLACRTVNKKLAKSVRDVVAMFKLMREVRVLPK